MRMSRRIAIIYTKDRAVTLTLRGAKNETVTYSGAATGSVTLPSSGDKTVTLPTGNYTFTGSVSGWSGSKSITSATTELCVWPTGAKMIYWYGRCGNGISYSHPAQYARETFTEEADSLKMTRGDNTYQGNCVFSNIPVSGYSKMYGKIYNNSSTQYGYFGNTFCLCSDNNYHRYDDTTNTPVMMDGTRNATSTPETSISSISGNYYPVVRLYSNQSSAYCQIYYFYLL